MDFQQLQEKVKESFNPQHIGLELKNTYKLQQDQNFIYRSEQQQTIKGQVFKIENKEDFPSLNKLQKSIQNLKIDINLQQNDHFICIRNLIKINKDDSTQKQDLYHENDQILVINLWATWCQPCQEQLLACEQFLAENPEYKENLKIKAISVDKDLSTLKQKIEDLKLQQNIEHYNIEGFDTSHDALSFFKVQSIPRQIIIGKQGTIIYIGTPFVQNFNQKIQEILKQDNTENQNQQDKLPEKHQKFLQQYSNQQEKDNQISQETYQKIKSFLDSEYLAYLNQNIDLYIDHEFNFNIELFNHELQSQSQDTPTKKQIYYKPIIKAQVKIQNLQDYEKLIKPLKDSFSEESLNIKTIIIDPKGNTKKNLQNLKTIIQSLNLSNPDSFQLQKTKQQILTINEKKQLKIIPKTSIQQKTPLNYQHITKEQKDTFQSQLEQQFLEQTPNDQEPFFSLLLDGIKTSQVGNPFQPILNLKTITGEQTQIEHQPNTLQAIMVWAPWSKPCLSFLKAIDDLLNFLKSEDEYKDKPLNFSAINLEPLEDEKNNGQKIIQEFTQQNSQIQFSFSSEPEGFKKRPEIINYCIQQIPFLILINSQGTIVYQGNLDNIKQNIIDLIKTDNISLQQSKNNLNTDNKPQYKQMKNTLKSLGKSFLQYESEILNHLSYKPQFLLENSSQKTLSSNLDPIETLYSQPSLTYQILEKDLPLIAPLLNDIKEQNPQLQINEQLIQTIDIPFESLCSNCERTIPDNSMRYWSYHLKATYCQYCADYEDTSKQGIERFKIPHNLVCIKDNQNLNNIETFKFGKNLQPQPQQPATQLKTHYACNSQNENCSKIGYRYICLNCIPGPLQDDGFNDYCQHCYEAANNSNHPEHVKISYLQKKEGHQNNHVFLRILFDIGGYYNF